MVAILSRPRSVNACGTSQELCTRFMLCCVLLRLNTKPILPYHPGILRCQRDTMIENRPCHWFQDPRTKLSLIFLTQPTDIFCSQLNTMKMISLLITGAMIGDNQTQNYLAGNWSICLQAMRTKWCWIRWRHITVMAFQITGIIARFHIT